MLRRTLLAAFVLVAGTAWAAPPTVPELLRLVPADARAVVAVDVAALRTEPLVQQWLLEHQETWSGVDDDAMRFLREAGLDPARDVDLMVFAVSGSEEAPEPLALFAGRYDPATLGAALTARGAELVGVGSVTAYRVGDGDETGHAALVRVTPGLVMVGTTTTLTAVYGPTGGPVHVVAAETAAGHLDLAAPFWMAVAVPEGAADPPDHAKAMAEDSPEGRAMMAMASASTSIRRVAAWARLGEYLQVHGFATSTSEENAGLFRDAVKGALAAMRLAAQEREPQLVDVLRGVTVKAEGTGVAVTAELPVELLKQLSREVHAHHHHAEVTVEPE